MSELTTLVVGASVNPQRFSNMAIHLLREMGITTYAFGLKEGTIVDVDIQTTLEDLPPIHTITMYINPQRQVGFIEELLALKPKRIIFNPGTESSESYALATAQGVHVQEACTLVLLRTGQYEMKD